jgi:hypothetical protein
MTGQSVRTSCRDLFKDMEILSLMSQYIPSILSFVVKNKNFLFQIMTAIIYGPGSVNIFTIVLLY